MYILSRVYRLTRTILNFSHMKLPFDRLDELHVSSASPLEAKVADSVVSNEIKKRALEEWKRRFVVYTVCRQDNIRMPRDVIGTW